MTQPDFLFSKFKKHAPLSPDLNVYAFTINSSSVLEIAGQCKNYGTVYMISIISMHALCNIDLTMVYVDLTKCSAPPPLFFLVLNYLFLENREN